MSNVNGKHSTGSVAEMAEFRESAGKDGRSLCGERTRVTGQLVIGPADLDLIWVKWRLLLSLKWS